MSKLGVASIIFLEDLEQAVFVRGGSILPILNHEGCLAILDCIGNSINLEVYLDKDGNASGDLYVDDGRSFDYQSDPNASAHVKFTFDGRYLKAVVNSSYVFGENQKIKSVNFYGIHNAKGKNGGWTAPESAVLRYENLQIDIAQGHLLEISLI
jgi:alpha-glucosidase (family GH31 glycosyl hydrolase)